MEERSKGINQRVTWSKIGSEANLNICAEIQKGFVHALWRDQKISTQLQGLYNLGNIAYAVLIGQFMGIEDSLIAKGIEEYVPNLNRSQFQKTDKNELIVDCYNANPDSMEGALENLRIHKHEHKWAILGDMFELGEASTEEHRKTIEQALDGQFEQVILVGEHFYRETTDKSGIVAFKTTAEAHEYLIKKAPEQKLVLIKGSRGMALEKLIPVL
jgi:UDP-N-acetylmuramoyl-tripeptide--D-alanyl-D-alanine ligase